MKRIILLAMLFLTVSCQESMTALSERVFDMAEQQCLSMEQQLPSGRVPRTYTPQGIFVSAEPSWWGSGFFAGVLWQVYDHTGNEAIKECAKNECSKLANVKACQAAHDLGFQYWCSYGHAWQTTTDEEWLPTIEDAARRLAERFNPTVGCIRSWGGINDRNNFLVIIDNMMNLELLMEASRLFCCDSLVKISNAHASTTMLNHFRPDYTSYHVVDYDQLTGEPVTKKTHQGYADESSWSRGQSWGLYGFTMMYRETGKEEYLAQAQAIADALIPRLPEDGVPYWDYDCPAIPCTYRDASAAAIMASALVELSEITVDRKLARKYRKVAEKQVRSLASSEYLVQEPGQNGGFLIRHCTGNLHGNENNVIREVDAPLIYADYYFLEALTRLGL